MVPLGSRVYATTGKVWDQLAGQKLNVAKSSMWSTTHHGRFQLRERFTGLPVVLEFEPLGARMYTSNSIGALLGSPTMAL